MTVPCPSENADSIDQSLFWQNSEVNWTPHRVGWAVSGGFALLTTIVTVCHVAAHARNYRVPTEQRHIIRILYMPTVFAIISWLSYRFFRAYTYYFLVQSIYEAFTVSAFLLLVIQYVATTSSTGNAEGALVRKDKSRLPSPLCCWRYRPTKTYFMYAVKWSVMQYVLIRPAASVAGVITQYYKVLCSSSFSWRYANVYITSIDFASNSIASYGLTVLYRLTRDELRGKRYQAKLRCIELITFFTFYQGFVFSLLENYHVIKGTQYWSSNNVANGLNALVTTIEMFIFSSLMVWAYPVSEYSHLDIEPKGARRAILDSVNFSDFGSEIYTSIRFFWHAVFTGKSYSRRDKNEMANNRVDFARAFLEYESQPNPVNQTGTSRAGPGVPGPAAV